MVDDVVVVVVVCLFDDFVVVVVVVVYSFSALAFPSAVSGAFFAPAKTTSVGRSSRMGIRSLRSQA